MTDRNTKITVVGVIAIIVGFFAVFMGVGDVLTEQRDADGYLMSDPLTIDRPSPVVISNDIDLMRGHYECVTEDSLIALLPRSDDVRVTGTAAGSEALFLGIAPVDAVATYLDGVPYDEITDWGCDQDHLTGVEYTTHQGSGLPDAPQAQTWWLASISGTGQQTVDWTIPSGEWAVVIMHADPSSEVSADVRFGAQMPSGMMTMAWILIAVGLPLLIAGGLIVFITVRRDRRTRPARPDDAGTELPPPPTEPPPEPVDPQRESVTN